MERFISEECYNDIVEMAAQMVAEAILDENIFDAIKKSNNSKEAKRDLATKAAKNIYDEEDSAANRVSKGDIVNFIKNRNNIGQKRHNTNNTLGEFRRLKQEAKKKAPYLSINPKNNDTFVWPAKSGPKFIHPQDTQDFVAKNTKDM